MGDATSIAPHDCTAFVIVIIPSSYFDVLVSCLKLKNADYLLNGFFDLEVAVNLSEFIRPLAKQYMAAEKKENLKRNNALWIQFYTRLSEEVAWK